MKGNAIYSNLQIIEADSARPLSVLREVQVVVAICRVLWQKMGVWLLFLPLQQGGERDWQHRAAVEFPSPWLTYLSWSHREDFGMSVQANWLDS